MKEYNVNTIKIFIYQKTRKIKILKTTFLFNVIKVVINQKKRFINCIVERLQRLLKRQQILNKKFFQKFDKTREIKI